MHRVAIAIGAVLVGGLACSPAQAAVTRAEDHARFDCAVRCAEGRSVDDRGGEFLPGLRRRGGRCRARL